MKTTTNKIITVAQHLVQKYNKAKLKISQYYLTQDQLDAIQIKFNNIYTLLNINNGTNNLPSYKVSGCGLLYFDGEYTYAGEYNGKPYYTRIYMPSAATGTTFTYYLSYRSGTSGWGITDQLEGTVTPYYYQSTVSETPDGGVYAVAKGTSPAPIITVSNNNTN